MQRIIDKVYAIKDLFGIRVTVSVNGINHVGEYLGYENYKCK